jgi:hypothetical protein
MCGSDVSFELTLKGVLVKQLEAGRHLLLLVASIQHSLDKGDSVRSHGWLMSDSVRHVVTERDLGRNG